MHLQQLIKPATISDSSGLNRTALLINRPSMHDPTARQSCATVEPPRLSYAPFTAATASSLYRKSSLCFTNRSPYTSNAYQTDDNPTTRLASGNYRF